MSGITDTFVDKIWVYAHISNRIISKKYGEHVFEKWHIAPKIIFHFPVPRGAMQYKRQRDNE